MLADMDVKQRIQAAEIRMSDGAPNTAYQDRERLVQMREPRADLESRIEAQRARAEELAVELQKERMRKALKVSDYEQLRRALRERDRARTTARRLQIYIEELAAELEHVTEERDELFEITCTEEVGDG